MKRQSIEGKTVCSNYPEDVKATQFNNTKPITCLETGERALVVITHQRLSQSSQMYFKCPA